VYRRQADPARRRVAGRQLFRGDPFCERGDRDNACRN